MGARLVALSYRERRSVTLEDGCLGWIEVGKVFIV
jgi:hypothetical protein